MPDPLLMGIVEAVADAKGIDSGELEYPLGEYIDPDAIEQLTAHDDASWTLSFELPEHSVTVTSDSVVLVDDAQQKIGDSFYSETDAAQLIDNAIDDGSETVEWLLETEDGDERRVKVTLRPVVLNGQRRVLASVVDISDSKDRERKQQWRTAIFEGSRDAIFISDTDAKFIDVNEAATELTGYSRDDLLSMRIPDLHDEPDLDAYQEYHDRILSGEPATTEAKIQRGDGSKVPVEFSNRRIEVNGDVYMHTVARDITDRKERERELRRAREQLTEGVPHGFFVVAADYSETYYVNSRIEELYGVSVEEAHTDPVTWMRHVHPDDIERLQEDIEAYQTGAFDGSIKREYRVQHPERGTRWLQAEVHPIENNGEVNRLAGIVTDITKRKKMNRTSPTVSVNYGNIS